MSTFVYFSLAIILIWLSSSNLVSSILKISRTIKLPSFVVSFFLLGTLTSVSEISVAINSYIDNTLEVAVGNLLGGIFLIFLLVIPTLAIAGKGVRLSHKYSLHALAITLITLMLPGLFFVDSYLLKREAIIILLGYIVSIFLLFFSHGGGEVKLLKRKLHWKIILKQMILIVVYAVILFLSSDLLIKQILIISTNLDISPFIISLFTLSIGTNLPELSLTVRSVVTGNKDVAFGNYLGSATMNLLILTVLTIVNNRILVQSNFFVLIIFSALGLGAFYYFITSKNDLSRKEGMLLIMIYLLFVITELNIHL